MGIFPLYEIASFALCLCKFFKAIFNDREIKVYPSALLKITKKFGKANITFFHPLTQNTCKMVKKNIL
jgi:hypothetical protein